MGEKGRGVGGKEGMNHKGRESGNGRGGGGRTPTLRILFSSFLQPLAAIKFSIIVND